MNYVTIGQAAQTFFILKFLFSTWINWTTTTKAFFSGLSMSKWSEIIVEKLIFFHNRTKNDFKNWPANKVIIIIISNFIIIIIQYYVVIIHQWNLEIFTVFFSLIKLPFYTCCQHRRFDYFDYRSNIRMFEHNIYIRFCDVRVKWSSNFGL